MKPIIPNSPEQLYSQFIEQYESKEAPESGFKKKYYLSVKSTQFQLITETCKDALSLLHCATLCPEWVKQNKEQFNRFLDRATMVPGNEDNRRKTSRIAAIIRERKLFDLVDTNAILSNGSLQLSSHRFFICARKSSIRLLRSRRLFLFKCSDASLRCLQMFFNEDRILGPLSMKTIVELVGLSKRYSMENLIRALCKSADTWDLNTVLSALKFRQERTLRQLAAASREQIGKRSQYSISLIMGGYGKQFQEELSISLAPKIIRQKPAVDYRPLIMMCSTVRANPRVLKHLKKQAPEKGWGNIKALKLLYSRQRFPILDPTAIFPNLKTIEVEFLLWRENLHPSFAMLRNILQIKSEILVMIDNLCSIDVRQLLMATLSPSVWLYVTDVKTRQLQHNIISSSKSTEYWAPIGGEVVMHGNSLIQKLYQNGAGTLDLSSTQYPAPIYRQLFKKTFADKINLAKSKLTDNAFLSLLADCSRLGRFARCRLPIEHLDLSDTHLASESLIKLATASQGIASLNVSGCSGATDKVICQLKKALPTCKITHSLSSGNKHAP